MFFSYKIRRIITTTTRRYTLSAWEKRQQSEAPVRIPPQEEEPVDHVFHDISLENDYYTVDGEYISIPKSVKDRPIWPIETYKDHEAEEAVFDECIVDLWSRFVSADKTRSTDYIFNRRKLGDSSDKSIDLMDFWEAVRHNPNTIVNVGHYGDMRISVTYYDRWVYVHIAFEDTGEELLLAHGTLLVNTEPSSTVLLGYSYARAALWCMSNGGMDLVAREDDEVALASILLTLLMQV